MTTRTWRVQAIWQKSCVVYVAAESASAARRLVREGEWESSGDVEYSPVKAGRTVPSDHIEMAGRSGGER